MGRLLLCGSKSNSRVLERVGLSSGMQNGKTRIEAFAIRLRDIVCLGKAGMESANLLHHISQWTCYAIHTVYEVFILRSKYVA
jgi:hypothetical protein